MWKSRDEKPLPTTPSQPTYTPPAAAAPTVTVKETPHKSTDPFRADVAHIGKSVLIKGELSGSEDLYLDGEVEGRIDLREHSLVIGPNGRIRANISARELVLHGRVEGNVQAAERVELKKSSTLMGDVSTQRIVIEDGAFFKGAIDIPKEARLEARKAVAAHAGSTLSSSPSSSVSSSPSLSSTSTSSSNPSPQSSLLEQKS
jgi:cytoskeletal protein CcmA (bactofilin family)